MEGRRVGMQPKTVIAAFFVALPAIVFNWILIRHAVNLPNNDDYALPLDFLNSLAELHGFFAKASYFLAAQHSEYKLFFENGLFWLLAIPGHIDFRLLGAIGNGFVLLLAILLWKMFLPECKDMNARLIFFIPVSWLLFQLQYAETLNWAMASLQNLPVLVFSLCAIHQLTRTTRRAYWGSLICLILAIASSGNGLLMVPIGVLMLALKHCYGRMAGWIAVSAGCIVAYAYRYNVTSSPSAQRSIFSAIEHMRPFYMIVFAGNALNVPRRDTVLVVCRVVCPLLGVFLCAFFIAMLQRRYFRKRPAVGYCVLFLFLTAAGVTAIRSYLGVWESLQSRYGMYSALLLIFAWFAIVEEYLLTGSQQLRRRMLTGAIATAVLFSASMDFMGRRYLSDRNDQLVQEMAAFEHSRESSGSTLDPLPMSSNATKWKVTLDGREQGILRESARLGIYRPPVL